MGGGGGGLYTARTTIHTTVRYGLSNRYICHGDFTIVYLHHTVQICLVCNTLTNSQLARTDFILASWGQQGDIVEAAFELLLFIEFIKDDIIFH